MRPERSGIKPERLPLNAFAIRFEMGYRDQIEFTADDLARPALIGSRRPLTTSTHT